MEIETIISTIGSLGFPIVMCIILVKYMQEQMTEMREAINELKGAILVLTERLKDKEET